MELKYGDRIKIKEWDELAVGFEWNHKFFLYFGGQFGRVTKINYVSPNCKITLDNPIKVPGQDEGVERLHLAGKDMNILEKHVDLPQELFEI